MLAISRRLTIAVAAVTALGAVTTFYGTRVVREISEDDRQYIFLIAGEKPVRERAGRLTYEQQIVFIRKMQASVLNIAGENLGIPYGVPREPKDLYQARHGLCFDRSAVIEKILDANGFEARHVALYRTEKTWPPWIALFIPGVWSHALTEVKTRQGWLVVESNREWISVDDHGLPVPLSKIQEQGATALRWDKGQTTELEPIFRFQFVYIYGLYSRHGYFFPPFVPLPDVYWQELPYNLVGD